MKHYLLASDFDQTLSFNDSGIALSELLGITGFEDKVAGLSRLNLRPDLLTIGGSSTAAESKQTRQRWKCTRRSTKNDFALPGCRR